jgi:hypothetical protein
MKSATPLTLLSAAVGHNPHTCGFFHLLGVIAMGNHLIEGMYL